MDLLAMVALVAATAGLLVWPLLRPRDRYRDPGSLPAAEPDRETEMALLAIRELEFDYSTGKLSADDYAALRSRYETRAVESRARGSGAPATHVDLDARIETLVAAARRRGRCPACGEVLPPRARFCAACGRPVAAGEGGR